MEQINWTDYLAVIQIILLVLGLGIIYGTLKTRLDYMEEKLDKHNNFINRVYELESNVRAIWRRIDDVCEELKWRNTDND